MTETNPGPALEKLDHTELERRLEAEIARLEQNVSDNESLRAIRKLKGWVRTSRDIEGLNDAVTTSAWGGVAGTALLEMLGGGGATIMEIYAASAANSPEEVEQIHATAMKLAEGSIIFGGIMAVIISAMMLSGHALHEARRTGHDKRIPND